MRIATVRFEGMSPYSQARALQSERGQSETHDDHENRVWRERMHVTKDGFVQIPPMAWKNALAAAAKYLSISIKGQGKKTYTKKFESGLLCMDPVVLDVKADDVPCERLFVPSNGQRGGGKRVWKNFPVISDWGGAVTLYIADDIITEDVLDKHVRAAGKFIGIGRFRPENNGYYGRFRVAEIDVSEGD